MAPKLVKLLRDGDHGGELGREEKRGEENGIEEETTAVPLLALIGAPVLCRCWVEQASGAV